MYDFGFEDDPEEGEPCEDTPVCPLHGLALSVACQARGCDAWVPGHAFHCGVAALQESAQEELSWSLLGSLLHLEPVVIERLARQAYESLRTQEIESDLPARWGLIRDSRRCVVCMKQGVIHDQGWSWCSIECAEWLPARLVAVEAKWGTRIQEILRTRPTLRALQKVIPLNRDDLCWLAWQHAGVNLYNGIDPPSLKPNPMVPSTQQIVARIRRAQKWRST